MVWREVLVGGKKEDLVGEKKTACRAPKSWQEQPPLKFCSKAAGTPYNIFFRKRQNKIRIQSQAEISFEDDSL